MVKLGVYEGRFSEHCYNVLRPKRYTLIGFWDYDQFRYVLEDAPQMRQLRSIHRDYYSNEPQKVLADAYENVKRRFADKPEIEIVKADIAEAADRFANESVDIIYLDGNHITRMNSCCETSTSGFRSCARADCSSATIFVKTPYQLRITLA